MIAVHSLAGHATVLVSRRLLWLLPPHLPALGGTCHSIGCVLASSSIVKARRRCGTCRASVYTRSRAERPSSASVAAGALGDGRRPLFASPPRRVVDGRVLHAARHDINIRGGQWSAFHRRHILMHAAKPRRVFNKARGWRRRHAAHDGRPRRSYARRMLWDAHCDWSPRELRISLVRRLHVECANPSLAEWWSTAVQLF